jgi:KipI family sensor histidine kinase inhibitor
MAFEEPQTACHIAPEGDRCLIVSLGSSVDPVVNRRIHALAERLLAESIPGVLDVVPAFTTVALHYRPEAFGEAPYDALSARIVALMDAGLPALAESAREVRIPVCYGGAFGPDLGDIAERCGCTPDDVVARHVASEHTVGMLGFAPGFPYLFGLDPRLSVPRRATPRTQIPPGSVAIAGGQSAIYPQETPGGWNLIGRTPLKLFDLARNPPCLLAPGDKVRFFAVTADEYQALAVAAA